MKTPLFQGSAVAIVTPFMPENIGKINETRLCELIDEQIVEKTAAIVICGTTGEASTLSVPEHLRAIEVAVSRTKKRVPVIAGTGANNTDEAIRLSEEAERLGADGLLVVTPYYNKTTQAGLIQHYTAIADKVNTPIILYNVPGRTSLSIAPETCAKLARHPNIIGMKEATTDLSHAMNVREQCPDDFYLWSGEDSLVAPLISMGGKGVISTSANVIPREMASICALALAGNFAEATAEQLRCLPLINAMFYEVNPIPVKTALNLMGKDVGGLRLPLCEMGEPHKSKLTAILNNMGLLPSNNEQ